MPANQLDFDNLQLDDIMHPLIPSNPVSRRKKTNQPLYQNRYMPYPRRQHALYQMQLTLLNATTIEDLVELIMPPDSPRHALAALLRLPQPQAALQARPANGLFIRILNYFRAMGRLFLRD